MSQFISIDTDVLIDFQRGNKVAARELALLVRDAPLAVSTVVQLELLVGSANKEILLSSEKLLRRLHVLPLVEEVGAIARDLIRQFSLRDGLKLADALIAATAIHYQVPLLTKNQRDFRFIPGLQLLPYPPTPA